MICQIHHPTYQKSTKHCYEAMHHAQGNTTQHNTTLHNQSINRQWCTRSMHTSTTMKKDKKLNLCIIITRHLL